MIDPCREEFERKYGYTLRFPENAENMFAGKYADQHIENMWKTWGITYLTPS